MRTMRQTIRSYLTIDSMVPVSLHLDIQTQDESLMFLYGLAQICVHFEHKYIQY